MSALSCVAQAYDLGTPIDGAGVALRGAPLRIVVRQRGAVVASTRIVPPRGMLWLEVQDWIDAARMPRAATPPRYPTPRLEEAAMNPVSKRPGLSGWQYALIAAITVVLGPMLLVALGLVAMFLLPPLLIGAPFVALVAMDRRAPLTTARPRPVRANPLRAPVPAIAS